MILQRYLLREILQSLAAVVLVIALIYISNRFVRFLTEAAAGRLASDLIFDLVALRLVASLPVLIPAGYFIAVLVSLGRLYKDSEMVAMWAGGFGLARTARGLVWISVAMAAVVLALSVYIAPSAAAMQDRLANRARAEAEIAGLVPGRFRDFGREDSVIYVEKVAPDRRAMRNVFVQTRGAKQQNVLVARRGYLAVQGGEGDRFMVLEDGYRYTGKPGQRDFIITRFGRHAVRLDRIGHRPGWKKLDSVPTLDLLRSSNRRYKAELQWRIGMPISVILLGLLAIPLARTKPQEGRYARLFTAVVAYFIYNNLLGVSQKLMERGELSTLIGMWPVHLVVAAIALSWMYMQDAGRWRLARMRGHDAEEG